MTIFFAVLPISSRSAIFQLLSVIEIRKNRYFLNMPLKHIIIPAYIQLYKINLILQMQQNQSLSLQDYFLRMGPQSQPQVLSYMLKCYSALTDPLITAQPFKQQFNKISNLYNLSQNFPRVHDYHQVEEFRNFFKGRLKDINLHNNCELIGYPFRKIYKEIQSEYFSSDCYLECKSVLSCWKIMKAKDIPLNIDEYYLHKIIDFYSFTLQSSLEGHVVNDEYNIDFENEVAVKIVLRTVQNIYEKKDQFAHFNHGFFIEQDKYVILNNLNIIKLVKVESLRMSKFKHLKKLVFELIPFIELKQMRGTVPTPHSQSVKRQCNQLYNYLEKLETVYHKDKQYELATATIKEKQKIKIKSNRQLWKKLGFEEYQLDYNLTEAASIQAVLQCLMLSKHLDDQQKYMFCLQKYQQMLEQCQDSDQKYCKKFQMEIELSLQIGLAMSQTNDHIKYLEKAVETILGLAKKLSLREEIQSFMQGGDREVESQGCFKSLFAKKVNVIIPIQHTARFDRNMADEFFPHCVPCQKSQKLRKFKVKICHLFRRLQEAIVYIQRYGIYSKKLSGIKEKIFSQAVEMDIQQIHKSIHSKQGESFSITSLNLDLEESLQVIQSKVQIFSIIQRQPSLISTEADLSNISSSVQSISIKVEEAISSFSSNVDKKKSKSAMLSCLRILDYKISFLEQNGYTNSSIALLQTYNKKCDILFSLGDIKQLEKHIGMKFLQEKKRNVITFKLGLYEKLSLLFYREGDFNNCTSACEQWFKLNESVLIKKPKKQLDLHTLRLKAMIQQQGRKIKGGKVEFQEAKEWVQSLERQIAYILDQWAQRFDKKRIRCFRIQMSLIKAEAKELRVDDQKYQEMLAIYKQVDNIRSQFYTQLDAKSILISIEILRLHYLKKQLEELDPFYRRIQKAFEGSSNLELQRYKWVLNLSLFFKEKSKGLRYIGVLPARTLIENCLFDFKELEDKGQFTLEMKKEYEKINQIYCKFMDEELRYFPKKNVFEIGTKTEQIIPATYENSYGSLPTNYNRTHWLLFVDIKEFPPCIIYNLRSNVFSYSQLTQKIFNIWESSQERFGFEGRKCSTVKLVIGWSRLKQQFIDKSNEIFLQNLDQLHVIAKEQFHTEIMLLKNRLRCRVRIIREEQQEIKLIFQNVRRYEIERNNYKNILPNALFYIKRHSKKIHQFHSIVLSCLAEQIYQKEFEKHHSSLINAFLQVNKQISNDNINDYLTVGTELNKLRRQIIGQIESAQINESLRVVSEKVVKEYQKESNSYPFINNTLRSLYENVEFDWRGFRKFIYPLYHSIQYLHQYQLEQGDFQQDRTMVVWRYAEMNEGELQLIRNLLSFPDSKPFIEFLSFLSTSESLSWVLKNLGKDARNLLLRIEVKMPNLRNSIMNNGFCRVSGTDENEVLFNLLNVFRVEKMEEEVGIRDILRDHYFQMSEDQEQKLLSLFRERNIRLIYLTLDDFTPLLNTKVKKDTDIALFQIVQSAFLKKRKKYESPNSLLRLSSYGTIEAFQDLGQPAKAQLQIIQRLNDRDYFLKVALGNEQNLFARVIRNCLKMGNIQLAQEYLRDCQSKLERLKDQFTDYNKRKLIATKIYDIKFSFMELFLGEKLGFQKEEDINMLQQELEAIAIQYNSSNSIRQTRQISLRLYRIIYYYEKGEMDKSFSAFGQTIKDLEDIIDKIKDLEAGQEKQKIRKFCKTISQQLKERIRHYTSLNANFSYEFNQASKNLLAVQKKFHQTSKGGTLEQNAKCCSIASLNIRNPQRLSTSNTRMINEQYETLSGASQLMQEDALSLNSNEATSYLIKDINFQLLGSLQKHKQRIHLESNAGIAQIMASYEKMMENMIESQIIQLQSEGHTRESPDLINAYRRMIEQKQRSNRLNHSQFESELNKNIYYSSHVESRRKHEEICRTWILRAEVEYARVEHQRLKNSTDSQEKYEQCMKNLVNAEKDLLMAYKIENQDEQRTCLSFFNYKDKRYEQNQRNIKMHRTSEQNMMINLLKAKIYHRQFRISNPLSKERVLASLRQLGWLVKERGAIFDVINEEIIVSQLYTLYALIIPKEINIGRECARLKDALDRREQMKGENNIENAVDCLQLFELASTGLKKRLGGDNYELLYAYVEKGTRSHENNDLFWRFVIIKFNMIKVRADYSGKQLEQYIMLKLSYLHDILILLEKYKYASLLPVNKIYRTFQRFNQNYIQKKPPVNEKVFTAIQQIQACNQRIQKRFLAQRHKLKQQSRSQLNQNQAMIEQNQLRISRSRGNTQQSFQNLNLSAHSNMEH